VSRLHMPDNNEIELTQWSRGILDLHDMSLEKKRGIIENFDGNLLSARKRAIDIDLSPARSEICILLSHFSPAWIIVQISIMPRKFCDCPERINAASLMIQSPTETKIGAQNVR